LNGVKIECMEKNDKIKEIKKQVSMRDKLAHLFFGRANKKAKKGFSFKIVYLSIIAIFIFLTVLELPEILTIFSGTTVTIPVLSTIEFKDKLNIWLTFDITVFTLVGSYSTYMQVVFGQEKGKVDDARTELGKLYGPIYSVLNSVVYMEETKGILLPFDKTMIDKKFSTYPYMLNQDLYDLWKKEIRSLEKTTPSFNFILDLAEKIGLDESNRLTSQHGVYLIPKAFVLKFLEEYDKKVYEYRQLIAVKDRF
jgi:hypothetical protein